MKKGHVNILGKKYTIVVDTEAMIRNGTLGMVDVDVACIVIRDNVPVQTVEDTILHEVVHAIDKELNLGFDEPMVSRLAVGLHSVGIRVPVFWDKEKKVVKDKVQRAGKETKGGAEVTATGRKRKSKEGGTADA